MPQRAESADTHRSYVPYRPTLEQRRPDEDELISKVVDALHKNNEWAYRKNGFAIRDAHAKSHGVLNGKLTINSNLPDHLRQGLFAEPGKTYPVIARLSSTHPAIRSDQIRGIRAIAIKVLDVEGERLFEDNTTTQDLVLVNHREFPYRDVYAYSNEGMRAAKLLARSPNTLLYVITEILAAAGRIGVPLPPAVALFAEPNTHILGQTFHSAAPLRYGDYVAKLSLVPLSDSVKHLQGQRVPRTAGFDAHRDMVADFFRHNSAEYEMRAQLCTDLKTMPIEDATKEWPESESPYCGVAKISFPAQEAGSPERRYFADEVLSFNSWRGLEAHRPLGSINRLKLRTYEASSRFRHAMNGAPRIEPSKVAELDTPPFGRTDQDNLPIGE